MPAHISPRVRRIFAALLIAATALAIGYGLGYNRGPSLISAEQSAVPQAGSVRVLYSLDKKQHDQEIIALIDEAEEFVYFAIYTFTLPSIADALVRAHERGVEVRGIVDGEQSRSSYSAPVISTLLAAGVPLVTERHTTGDGIMHLKTLVTESAYATGSYNWTLSATQKNDELLEIGTDPALRQIYEDILRRLMEAYKGNAAAGAAASRSGGTYDYTEAKNHIGEYATVRGVLVDAYTSAKGTVFLDFCESYKSCPFSGVIFADDAAAFGDLSRYRGKMISLTGTVSLYEGRAEIKLSRPSQIKL